MNLTIFTAILAAAMLHALWNTLVKIPGDALVRLTLINTTAGACGLLMIPFVGIPSGETWLFLAASGFVHLLYNLSLLAGYRTGDLSLVYPISRGVAPLLVTMGGYLFASETVNPYVVIGIVISSLGILSLAFTQRQSNTLKPILFALATGTCIAGYTLIDGLGGRSTHVMTYIAWVFVIDALPLLLITVWLRRHQKGLLISQRNLILGCTGGLFAFLAYALVIWAMNHAPMASVSAIRETSVIFATLIGVYYLKESMGYQRLVSSVLVAFGVGLIQLGSVW